jgi:DNA-directed RNA polymerase specialized sigma24 family protein
VPSPAAAEPPDVGRRRRLALVRTALRAAVGDLDARDRLRLSLYYSQQLKLAAVGRVLGESEATVSRKLERTRADLRRAISRYLREAHGLSDAEINACFDDAPSDPAFDLARLLPQRPGESGE